MLFIRKLKLEMILKESQLTAIVPIVESSKNEKMPPIVGMASKVDLSCDPSFWYSENVNYESDDDETVHSNNAWNKNLEKTIIK